VVERGEELERLTTKLLDELLYRVFESIISTLSYDYELQNRVEGQDGRRIAFPKQIELFRALSPEWANRCAEKIDETLKEYPFNDQRPASRVPNSAE
jgi:hypothetical protein